MPKVNNNDKKKVSTVKKNKNSAKLKSGRKSKYETHVLPNINRIPKWRRDGMTEEQVAKKCGVAYSTFKLYLNKYSALSAAIKKGREDLIEELEDSLYKRAMGFEYEEVEESSGFGAQGPFTKSKRVVKFLPPDTGALIFALKNLKGDKWQNRDRVEISTDKESSQILSDVAKQFSERGKSTDLAKIDSLGENNE